MFLQFTEDKERMKYGGSAFLELQYCKAKRDTLRLCLYYGNG